MPVKCQAKSNPLYHQYYQLYTQNSFSPAPSSEVSSIYTYSHKAFSTNSFGTFLSPQDFRLSVCSLTSHAHVPSIQGIKSLMRLFSRNLLKLEFFFFFKHSLLHSIQLRMLVVHLCCSTRLSNFFPFHSMATQILYLPVGWTGDQFLFDIFCFHFILLLGCEEFFFQ